MLKSTTATDRSDQTTRWARTAADDALLIENSVVSPFGLLRSTSKYGRSSVAAGTASMVQMTADAGGTENSRAENASRSTVRRISHLPFFGSSPAGSGGRGT